MARAIPDTLDGIVKAIENAECKNMQDVKHLCELMQTLVANTNAAIAVGAQELRTTAFFASEGSRAKANKATRPVRNAMILLELAARRLWSTPRVFRKTCEPERAATARRKFEWKA